MRELAFELGRFGRRVCITDADHVSSPPVSLLRHGMEHAQHFRGVTAAPEHNQHMDLIARFTSRWLPPRKSPYSEQEQAASEQQRPRQHGSFVGQAFGSPAFFYDSMLSDRHLGDSSQQLGCWMLGQFFILVILLLEPKPRRSRPWMFDHHILCK